ncbi:glutathione transferase gst 23 [Quercus suber]|uniref:Glutathione S-transferase n=1 Tax=Quercus suber TaxID=58331 RepID=A0AAW0KRZ8_QUESU
MHYFKSKQEGKENVYPCVKLAKTLIAKKENTAPAAILSVFRSNGKEQKKALKDSLEMLKIMEEQGLGEKKFLGGDRIRIVDIAFGTIAHWYGVIEEIIEVKVLEAHALPRLHAW